MLLYAIIPISLDELCNSNQSTRKLGSVSIGKEKTATLSGAVCLSNRRVEIDYSTQLRVGVAVLTVSRERKC